MFTQCYKCETVFRLSAESLRAAGGQVRCGRCGEVFNALARLAEDATGFTQGESSFELESRADEILHSPEPAEPQESVESEQIGPPGSGEVARLQVLGPADDDAAPEGSLEFTLPAGELDRIFVETSPSVLKVLAAEGLRAQRAAAQAAQAAARPASKTPSAPNPQHADSNGAPPPPTSKPIKPTPAKPPAPPASTAVAAAPAPPATPAPPAAPAARVPGLAVSEEARLAVAAGIEAAQLPQILAPPRQFPQSAWIASAIVLTLMLLGQWASHNLAWLGHRAPGTGGESAAAQLAAYQLRQWGVTGDPTANGTLRVRATILNVSGQLQPYPLLRLTLANRFGTRIAQRDFEPPEYMGHPTPHMLSPGEHVDALLDVLDPGKDAEGFEIDVCVRDVTHRVECAGDAAPQSR